MKRFIALGVAAFATLAFVAAAIGAPPSSHGPYSVVSTDHGCAGQAWATDTLQRTWDVKKGPGTNTWRVTRNDKGTFQTLTAASPGSCAYTTGPHGTHITAGIIGKVHGREAGTVTGGTYNPAGTCANPCTNDAFMAGFFSAGAQFTCNNGYAGCSFEFDYSVQKNHNPGLLYNHWTDRDNGGTGEIFEGDIADS